MVTVYDIPPEKLIYEVAEKLKEDKKIKVPEWTYWVTTGVHKERGPEQEDWWYIRLASVLRKTYIKGPVGTSRLSSEYGGKEDRGSKRYKARKGSRSIVRKCFQQLESLGYVKKDKNGRAITPQGRAFLDNIARDIMKDIVKENKVLKKYMK